jgi:Zn-dependent protease with chaperone function
MFNLIENFVFFNTIFAIAAFLLSWGWKVAAEKQIIAVSPFWLGRLFAGAICVPPIISLWLLLAALLPQVWLPAELVASAHQAPAHELHLFGDITSGFEPYLSYVTALLFFAVVAVGVWKSLRGYLRFGRVVDCLEIQTTLPTQEQLRVIEEFSSKHSLNPRVISTSQPFTFVWGIWNTKLIISTGLLNVLSGTQLLGVLEHEAAHHVRRDNCFKFILSFLSYLSIAFPLTRLIANWHAQEIEFVCDEIAAAQTKSPLEIASALVMLSRTKSHAISEMPFAISFLKGKSSIVERRVRRLLEFDHVRVSKTVHQRTQAAPKYILQGSAAIFSLTLVTFLLLRPLAVHQTAEFLFQMIK